MGEVHKTTVCESNGSAGSAHSHPPLSEFHSTPLIDPSKDPLLREDEVVTVDVHAAKHLMFSGHRYLDVRTEKEFNRGHLENALNVPYQFDTPQGREKNPKFVEQVSSLCDKYENIVVGCQSGVRSLQASAELLNAGFKYVKNMGGGYAAWTKNGFAVTKLEGEEL